MIADRMLLLELGTGQPRPMRPGAPLFSRGNRAGDGFLVEEHAPAEWESNHVSLLNSAVFLTLDEGAALQWRGGGTTVSKRIAPDRSSILPANHPYSVRLRTSGRSLVVSLKQRLLSCAAVALGELGWVEPVWVHGLDDRLLREQRGTCLDGFDEIKICTGYRLDGADIDHLPASQAAQARVQPVYESIEGWKGTTHAARSWGALPAQAIKYVRRIEELIGAPVALASTSPERDDTILVHNPFQD